MTTPIADDAEAIRHRMAELAEEDRIAAALAEAVADGQTTITHARQVYEHDTRRVTLIDLSNTTGWYEECLAAVRSAW